MISADIELSSTGDILISSSDIGLLFGDDLIKQLAVIMVRSQLNEWALFPELGFGLSDFMKQPNTEELASEIQDRIYYTFSMFPAFDDYTPVVDVYPTDADALRIDLSLINPNQVAIDIPIDYDLLHGVFQNTDEFQPLDHTIYLTETIRRIERKKVKQPTSTLEIQFQPAAGEVIRIYPLSSYPGAQDDQEYDETITLTPAISSNREIDFKTQSNFYNDIVNAGHQLTKIVIQEDWDINVIELKNDDYVYTFPEEILWHAIQTDGEIRLKVYYVDALATATPINVKPRVVTNDAISPENEDAYTYIISTSQTLQPDIYVLDYISYATVG